MDIRQIAAGVAMACGLAQAGSARAVDLSTTLFGREIEATLNNAITAGVGVRMQKQSVNLVGKSAINPFVCAPPYQSCQGLFREQSYTAAHFAGEPGDSSRNHDRGNLNYDRYDLFQAPLKLTSDLSVKLGNVGAFVRVLAFYDAVNDDFTEFDPNELTPENRATTGRADPTFPGGRVYGAGGVVREQRTDQEVLRQAGADVQLLDALVHGDFELGGTSLGIKLGRQTLNWGESTTLLLNSISQATPLNANNVFRIGSQVEEYFQPTNMVSMIATFGENATLAGYYKLEWRPTEIPAPGTYFSDINVGTNNAIDYLNIHPGNLADDPDCLSYLLDNPLSLTTNSCSRIRRVGDFNARDGGQFGVNLGYTFAEVGTGVQVNAYYQRYHSQLPLVGFFATHPSCARPLGNALGIDTRDLVTFALACPDLPLTHLATGDPENATSNILLFDEVRFAFEYPENIDLFGLSFNTVVGEYSIQGEVAYRPNKPLQVDVVDLAFAALGPTLSSCHNRAVGCSGSALGGLGNSESGAQVRYGSSDFVPGPGVAAYPDTIAAAVLGAFPGAARAFPNFVIPYRGGTLGENAPCFPESDARYQPYTRDNPCYIQGYERFDDYNFNFSLTRVLGASDNWLGADQIILVYEAGAEWVPDLPALDVLPLQGPGAGRYGPVAGADGSGADGSRAACSTNPACSIGPDGLRFNIHQQERDTFPTPLSTGHRVIAFLKYESVLPSISLQPLVMLKQDLTGISPGPGGNFVRGRKEANLIVETRYRAALSLGLGYNWYWGAGALNSLSDRDFAQAFVRYQF